MVQVRIGCSSKPERAVMPNQRNKTDEISIHF